MDAERVAIHSTAADHTICAIPTAGAAARCTGRFLQSPALASGNRRLSERMTGVANGNINHAATVVKKTQSS